MCFSVRRNTKRRLFALFLAGLLLASAAGCSAAPPASSSPGSSQLYVSASSSYPPAEPPSSVPLPETEPGQPLQFDDFAVYSGGIRVLDLEAVAFYRFTFAENSESNRLDPTLVTTLRGLKLGADQSELARLYGGLPVSVTPTATAGEEPVTSSYDSMEAYLESENASDSYEATFSLYFFNTVPEYDLGVIADTLANSLYTPDPAIVHYDLDAWVEQGKVVDVALSKNDMTMFPLGAIEQQLAVDTEDFKVTALSLYNQVGQLCLHLALLNKSGEPVVVQSLFTAVSGKATRKPGALRVPLAPGEYAEDSLILQNDDIRAAGVQELSSLSIALQFLSEDGEVLYESEAATIPVLY